MNKTFIIAICIYLFKKVLNLIIIKNQEFVKINLNTYFRDDVLI